MKNAPEKTSGLADMIPVWSHRLSPVANTPNLSFLQTGLSSEAVEWILQHVLTHPTSRLTCIEEKTPADLPHDPRMRVLGGTVINMLGLLQRDTFDAACIGTWKDAKDLQDMAGLMWKSLRTDGLLIVAMMENDLQSSPLPGDFGCAFHDAALMRYESQVILRKMDGDPASTVRFDL